MGSILINSFTAPVGVTADIYAADADGNNQELLPGVFSQIGFTDNDGNFSSYPVLFDILATSTIVSLTADCSNGCVLTFQQVCSPSFPTPTPTDLPPCYFAAVSSLNGPGNTLTYTDCNGTTTAYTSTAEALVYLCMPFQNVFNVDFSVNLDSGYDCYSIPETSPLQWVGEPVPSLTPTPTSVTPTPTPTDAGFIYETITFGYTYAATMSNRTQPITIALWPEFVGAVASATTTDMAVTITAVGSSFAFVLPTSGTSSVTLTLPTSTPGVINGVKGFTISTNNEVVPQTTGLLSYGLTATTTNLKKFTAAENINIQGPGFYPGNVKSMGNIQELSGLTSLKSLTLNSGYPFGDVQYLPDSIQTFVCNGLNTISGQIGDLPSSIRELYLFGLNTLSGNLSQLAANNLFTGGTNPVQNIMNICGNNTITGNMSDLPNIGSIFVTQYVPLTPNGGQVNLLASLWDNFLRPTTGNTIGGNLTLKSNQRTLAIGGANTITGSISATTTVTELNRLTIAGFNTISGDMSNLRLPNVSLVIYGNNILSGSINQIINLNNPGFAQFIIAQEGNLGLGANNVWDANLVSSGNTISGNISAFQQMSLLSSLRIGGNNTITGNLSVFTNPVLTFTDFYIVSPNNTINGTNFTTNSPNIFVTNQTGYLVLKSNNTNNGLSSTEVNKLFNYLVAKSQVPNLAPGIYRLRAVIVNGTGHSAPTGAGLTSKNTYASYGATVETN